MSIIVSHPFQSILEEYKKLLKPNIEYKYCQNVKGNVKSIELLYQANKNFGESNEVDLTQYYPRFLKYRYDNNGNLNMTEEKHMNGSLRRIKKYEKSLLIEQMEYTESGELLNRSEYYYNSNLIEEVIKYGKDENIISKIKYNYDNKGRFIRRVTSDVNVTYTLEHKFVSENELYVLNYYEFEAKIKISNCKHYLFSPDERKIVQRALEVDSLTSFASMNLLPCKKKTIRYFNDENKEINYISHNYDSGGIEIKTEEISYNQVGQKTSHKVIDNIKGQEVLNKYLWTGQYITSFISSKIMDGVKSASTTLTREYNNEGLLIYQSDDGGKVYKYEFDEIGNWVVKTHFIRDELFEKESRIIKYW